jgi:hypothetical protein
MVLTMAIGSCQTCAYFDLQGASNPDEGLCRRFPPTAMADNKWRWPSSQVDDSCGSWESSDPAPKLVTRPVITGTFVQDTDVTVTQGVWQSDITMTVSWQWYLDAAAVAGETASTFRLPLGSTGQKVTVIETAFNANGVAASASPSYAIT